jgi:hypothetical protein
MTKDKKLKMNEKARNWYLFKTVYSMNGDFNKAINRLCQKWELPLNNITDDSNVLDCLKEFYKIRGRTNSQKLIDETTEIIQNFDLGMHWRDSLLNFILSGKETVPDYSFGIQGSSIKEKRVILELGPHTALKDIKNNWPEIERFKEKVWPRVKKEKISAKSLENYVIWKEDLELRLDPLAEKISDNDIVSEIWCDEEDISSKTDKKRVHLLRQARKRGKRFLKRLMTK